MTRTIFAGGALAAAALTGGWWTFAWGAQGDAIASAREEQAVNDTQQSKLLAQLRDLSRRKAEEPQAQAALADLTAAVPDVPDPAAIFSTLDGAARQSGVRLQAVAPSPAIAPKTGGGAASSRVTFTVVGRWAQVLGFVDAVAAADRLVVVDGLSIASDAQGTLTVQLDARSFAASTGAPTTATTAKVAK